MSFSRINAFIAAFLIIAVFTLAGIALTLEIGSTLHHGPDVVMDGGFIKKFDTPNSFEFVTDEGQVEHFECIERCVGAQAHMQRHINEHAHTNVYYMQTPNGDLYAVDVD